MISRPSGAWNNRAGPAAFRLRAIDRALLWAIMGALLWAIVDRIARTGPLTLSRPATVLENADPAIRPISPYLGFLGELKTALPNGVTVAVLSDRKDSECLIAIGQLPRQRVLWPCEIRPGIAAARQADYVASFQVPLTTMSASLAARMKHGFLYRPAR